MRFFTIFSCTILTIFGFLSVHAEESSSVDNHMGSITRIALLAVVGMLMGQYRVSEACSCQPQHPQTEFCQSDFVGVVKVKQVVTVNPYQKSYEFKIVELFKFTTAACQALAEVPFRLWSPSFSPDCAPEGLTLNEERLVTGRVIGNKLEMSSCDISKLWSKVSDRQRENFQRFYADNCGCRISSIPSTLWGGRRPATLHQLCLWDNSPGPKGCQERFGVCKDNKQGVCNWEPSSDYNECISGIPTKTPFFFPTPDPA